MSALLSRSAPVPTRDLDPALARGNGPRRGRNRVAEWMSAHAATLAWIVPIVVIAGVVEIVGFAMSPAFAGSEYTLAMQSWSVNSLGRLTPYAYTWDSPPLGWLQVSGWIGLTGGFARYSTAVVAAREAMVPALLASVVLLWFLARRMRLSRAAAGVAVILFAILPAAVQLHRVVSLDNLAVPWLLLALLLATFRRNQLLVFAASAAAFGVAVLTQETFLLALPLLAFVAWRNAHADTRRYVLAVAAAVFLVTIGVYVMFAVLEGQFLPGSGHPSLVQGLEDRFSGDSPWASQLGITALVALLPIAALVVGFGVNRVIKSVRARVARRGIRTLIALVVAAAAVATAVPLATPQLRDLTSVNRTLPANAEAQRWVVANVPKDSRLIVDNVMWVELVKAGFTTDNVVWFPKLDSDPAVRAQSPQGWRDSDYVVSTQAMRSDTSARAAHSALSNSQVIASFGTGAPQIQVRRIEAAGSAKANADAATARAQRVALGGELADNALVAASLSDRERLRSGAVDPRIPLLVAQLATGGRVTIARLPSIAGESGRTIREVVISSVSGRALSRDGRLTAEGRAVAASLKPPYEAQATSAVPSGLLVEFPIVLPAGIIQ